MGSRKRLTISKMYLKVARLFKNHEVSDLLEEFGQFSLNANLAGQVDRRSHHQTSCSTRDTAVGPSELTCSQQQKQQQASRCNDALEYMVRVKVCNIALLLCV